MQLNFQVVLLLLLSVIYKFNNTMLISCYSIFYYKEIMNIQFEFLSSFNYFARLHFSIFRIIFTLYLYVNVNI